MLIDLHCHTFPRSADSSLGVDDLIDLARAGGLDGICLTEHDRLWPADKIAALRERHNFVVLRAMEVTTELGHVLVFGLDREPAGMFFAATLRKAVDAAGGVMALAHPARSGMPRVEVDTLVRLFDTVEALNGSDGPEQNRSAGALTAHLALPGIGGSDCHSPNETATAATRFSAPVCDEAGLVSALKAGAYHAVTLLKQ